MWYDIYLRSLFYPILTIALSTAVSTSICTSEAMVHNMMQKKHLIAKVSVLSLGLGLIFVVLKDGISSPLIYQHFRGNANDDVESKIYIPSTLDADSQSRLLSRSLDLGGGNCKWMPPQYDVPDDIEFHKTFIAGYPSGDKRMVYLQMEALAGYPAKDEWDFAYLGMTNHPFIKGNYPHHEGIWGWGDAADQVVMMVPHIRRSMVEYHDILWDLGYATTYADATLLRDKLYGGQPQMNDYYEWRDSRVLDEARWYGWYIDYWMEGGLLRDIFTHKLTTKEHWDDLMLKPFYARADLDMNNYVQEGTTVSPAYDPHCANLDISGGCEPVAIISADKLQHPTDGKAETSAIASALMNDSRTGQHVIAQRAWDCIWRELIEYKKGPRIMSDRPGYGDIDQYNFSSEMLEEMIEELDRLITKYSGSEWNTKLTAIRLIEILTEHRDSVQVELNEINSGARKLTDKDFLGPRERAKRMLERQQNGESNVDHDHSRYFIALEQKRFEEKRRAISQAPTSKKDEAIAGSNMSDGEFMDVLSNTLEQIRTLEAAGEMDAETANDLAEKVRDVAKVTTKASIVLGEDVVTLM